MIFMRVNVPDKPGTYPFVSWQKYTDGSVVWWNEPRGPGVSYPFPTVRVEQAPSLYGRPPANERRGYRPAGTGVGS